jgi:hypothetical protein
VYAVGVVVDTGHPLLAGGNEPWNDELNPSNGLSPTEWKTRAKVDKTAEGNRRSFGTISNVMLTK